MIYKKSLIICFILSLFFLNNLYADKPGKELLINVQKNPGKAEVHYELASYYESKENYVKAIVSIKKAIGIDSENSLYYVMRGSCYQSMGKYKMASKDFETALRISPDENGNIYSLLAMAYTETGRFKLAIRNFKRAIELNSNDANKAGLYFGIGNSYGNLKEFKKSIIPLQKAIKIEPDMKNAHLLLGLAYQETGDKDAAFKEYLILSKLDNELSIILLNHISK